MAGREQLHRFLRWVTGKHTQAELDGGTGRTFRRETAWCWQLQPRMPVTGEVHDAVLVDGIWVGSWCLLIALSDTGHVIAWQWAARESTAAWTALFDQVPPPAVVVTDGGSGIRFGFTHASGPITRRVSSVSAGASRRTPTKIDHDRPR